MTARKTTQKEEPQKGKYIGKYKWTRIVKKNYINNLLSLKYMMSVGP